MLAMIGKIFSLCRREDASIRTPGFLMRRFYFSYSTILDFIGLLWFSLSCSVIFTQYMWYSTVMIWLQIFMILVWFSLFCYVFIFLVIFMVLVYFHCSDFRFLLRSVLLSYLQPTRYTICFCLYDIMSVSVYVIPCLFFCLGGAFDIYLFIWLMLVLINWDLIRLIATPYNDDLSS